jgi:hypothetical protein
VTSALQVLPDQPRSAWGARSLSSMVEPLPVLPLMPVEPLVLPLLFIVPLLFMVPLLVELPDESVVPMPLFGVVAWLLLLGCTVCAGVGVVTDGSVVDCATANPAMESAATAEAMVLEAFMMELLAV